MTGQPYCFSRRRTTCSARAAVSKRTGRWLLLVSIALAILCMGSPRRASAGARAYVPGTEQVWVLDTATDTVVTTVPVPGLKIGAVAVDAVRGVVYVNSEEGLIRIDARTNQAAPPVSLPSGQQSPGAIAVDPRGGRAFVVTKPFPSVPLSGAVSVYDADANAFVAAIPAGPGPVEIAVNPTGTHAYVTDGMDDSEGRPCSNVPPASCRYTLAVLDLTQNVLGGRATIGDNLDGVAVNPVSGVVYVAYQIPVPPTGHWCGALAVPFEAGGGVRSTECAVPELVEINAPFHIELGLDIEPASVAVSPDGSRVYVSEIKGFGPPYTFSVAVIDTATNTLVTEIPISGLADLAVHPDGTRVYAVQSGGRISVIDTATNTVAKTITLPDTALAGVAIGPEEATVSPTPTSSATPATPTPTATIATPQPTASTTSTVPRTLTPTSVTPSQTRSPTAAQMVSPHTSGCSIGLRVASESGTTSGERGGLPLLLSLLLSVVIGWRRR